jgi:hypothetical protein
MEFIGTPIKRRPKPVATRYRGQVPLTLALERRLLQIAVAVGGGVPVAAGVAGALWGPSLVGPGDGADLDSHFRYLSGLLAAIGVLYWSTIPRIEVMSGRFSLLTLIVVTGGLCRALGMLVIGPASQTLIMALVMELLVTPALYLWQGRVARQAVMAALSPPGAGTGADAQAARRRA